MTSYKNLEDPVIGRAVDSTQAELYQTGKTFAFGKHMFDQFMERSKHVYGAKMLALHPGTHPDDRKEWRGLLKDEAKNIAANKYASKKVEKLFPELRGLDPDDPMNEHRSDLIDQFSGEFDPDHPLAKNIVNRHAQSLRHDYEGIYKRDHAEWLRVLRDGALVGPYTLSMPGWERDRVRQGSAMGTSFDEERDELDYEDRGINVARAYQEMYTAGQIPDRVALDFFMNMEENPDRYPALSQELQRRMADPTPPAERSAEQTGVISYVLESAIRGLSGGMGTGISIAREGGDSRDGTVPMFPDQEGPPGPDQFRPEDVMAAAGPVAEKLAASAELYRKAEEQIYLKVKDPHTLALDMPGRGYRTVERVVPDEAAEYLKQRDEILDTIEKRGFLGMESKSSLLFEMLQGAYPTTMRQATERPNNAALGAAVGALYKALLPDTDPSKHKEALGALGLKPENIHSMTQEMRALKNGYARRAHSAVEIEIDRGITRIEDADQRMRDYTEAMVTQDSGQLIIENPEALPLIMGLFFGPEYYLAKGIGAVAKTGFKAGERATKYLYPKAVASAEAGNRFNQRVVNTVEWMTDFRERSVAGFRKHFIAGSQWDVLRQDLNAASNGKGDELVHALMLVDDEAFVMRQEFQGISRALSELANKAVKKSRVPKSEGVEHLWKALDGEIDPDDLLLIDEALYDGYLAIKDSKAYEHLRLIMERSGAARKVYRGKVSAMGDRGEDYLPKEVDIDAINDVLGEMGFGVKSLTGGVLRESRRAEGKGVLSEMRQGRVPTMADLPTTVHRYRVRPLNNAIDLMRQRADKFAQSKYGPDATLKNLKDADVDELYEKLMIEKGSSKWVPIDDHPGGEALKKHIFEEAVERPISPGRLESAGKANTRYTHTRTELAEAFPIKDLARASLAYGNRVGRSVETSARMKGYREVLEEYGLYSEGYSQSQLEALAKEVAGGLGETTAQLGKVEKGASRQLRRAQKKKKEADASADAYKETLGDIDKELKAIAAEREDLLLRQGVITATPRTSGFARSETEKLMSPVSPKQEQLGEEMLAGLGDDVPGAIDESMRARQMGVERAGGQDVVEAYGQRRSAQEASAIEEQKLSALTERAAQLRRQRDVIDDWGAAVAEKRGKTALGDTAEAEEAARHGTDMAILDDHTTREWLKVTGREGLPLGKGGASDKVVVPRSVAAQLDRMLPLQSANLKLLNSMGLAERQQYKIFDQSIVQDIASLYKGYIQPLGSVWRLGHTSLRGLPFVTTNMQGGIGLAYLNNGLRFANPELSQKALNGALIAAYGGDDAARATVHAFKSGQKATVGEIVDRCQGYGITRQLDIRFGLDIGASADTWAGALSRKLVGVSKKLHLHQASQIGDDFQKLITVFNKLEGMDRRHWAKAADLVHAEAGHWLRMTPTEKNYLRNLFGFYSWNRYIVPRTLKSLTEHPERMANFDRGARLINEQTQDRSVFPGAGPAWLKATTTFSPPSWMMPSNVPTPHGGDTKVYLEAPQNTLKALVEDPRSAWLQLGGPEVRFVNWMLTGRDTRGKRVRGIDPMFDHPGDFASFEDFNEALSLSVSPLGKSLGEAVKTFLPITDAVQKTINFYDNEEVGMHREAQDLRTRAMMARYWGNLDWLYSVGRTMATGERLELDTPFSGAGFLKTYVRDLRGPTFRQREVMER